MRIVLFLACMAAALLPSVSDAAAYRFEDATSLDHRDQWGLRLELGSVLLASTDMRGRGGTGAAALIEVGLSRGLSFTGHELSARLRSLISTQGMGLMLLGGYRAFAGDDHWKTFADIDVVLPIVPGPAAGLRLGLGVSYDPNRRLGFSVSGGAFGAIGAALISGFDLLLGVQLRFD